MAGGLRRRFIRGLTYLGNEMSKRRGKRPEVRPSSTSPGAVPKLDLDALHHWAQQGGDPIGPPIRVVAANEERRPDRFDSACAGKEPFDNEQAANAAQLYRERRGVRNEGMTAYKCSYCGRWHLGHSKS